MLLLRCMPALALVAGAIALRAPLGEANAARRLLPFRYSPNPRIVKLLAAGHRSTFADLLWLNTLPDLSRTFPDAELKKSWIDGMLYLITDLEPGFSTVYAYGASFMEIVDRDGERAIALLERGVERLPDNLDLRVQLAMEYFRERQDRDATIRTLEPAIENPRCSPLTRGFYSSLLIDERADAAALMQWMDFLEDPNPLVSGEAERRLQMVLKRIAIRAWNEYLDLHGNHAPQKELLREERFMAPAVYDAVLGCFEIEPGGQRLRFPRLLELERDYWLYLANQWTVLFHNENQCWPTMQEVWESPVLNLPPPPSGQEYAVEKGKVGLREIPPGS